MTAITTGVATLCQPSCDKNGKTALPCKIISGPGVLAVGLVVEFGCIDPTINEYRPEDVSVLAVEIVELVLLVDRVYRLQVCDNSGDFHIILYNLDTKTGCPQMR